MYTVLFLDSFNQLVVQKSFGDQFSNSDARSLSIYFPPTLLQRTACLQINFTSYSYFSIKLLYTFNDTENKELLLYRRITSLGDKYRLWQTAVRPEMTQFEEFVLVLTFTSLSHDVAAVINDVVLQDSECNLPRCKYCLSMALAGKATGLLP